VIVGKRRRGRHDPLLEVREHQDLRRIDATELTVVREERFATGFLRDRQLDRVGSLQPVPGAQLRSALGDLRTDRLRRYGV
jgi:hypothetical protein